jgi:hypothetical protein
MAACPDHPEASVFTLYIRPKGGKIEAVVGVMWCGTSRSGHILSLVPMRPATVEPLPRGRT